MSLYIYQRKTRIAFHSSLLDGGNTLEVGLLLHKGEEKITASAEIHSWELEESTSSENSHSG